MPSTEVVIAKRFNNLLRPLQVHINRTTVLAGELAAMHGVDVEACELAASTHDLFRSEPDFAQISAAQSGKKYISLKQVVPLRSISAIASSVPSLTN